MFKNFKEKIVILSIISKIIILFKLFFEILKLNFSLIIIFISIIIFFINHPLAIGLFILIQTIIISIFIGIFINTYWFSYILFIVFIGGLLVLFIYISRIASNEKIKFSLNIKFNFLFIIILSFWISYFFYKNLNFINLFQNNEISNYFHNFFLLNNNNFNLTKLYNKQTYFLTILLIIYLFITLIVVIKITNIFFGPLRSFN